MKAYTTFHGPDYAGLKELRVLAVTQPMPPAGFKIKNKNEIEAEKEEQAAKDNPQLALWKSVKDQLIAANGEQYFTEQMKDHAVPKLKGKLVSMARDSPQGVGPRHPNAGYAGSDPEAGKSAARQGGQRNRAPI